MNRRDAIKVTLLSAVVVFCLLEFMLHRQNGIFREFEASLLSLQWMLLACISVWCGAFLLLTFGWHDLPLIGLLVIAMAASFMRYPAARAAMDGLMVLFGPTLGKGARFALRQKSDVKGEAAEVGDQSALTPSLPRPMGERDYFLVGLVLLLAFSSWCHLDMADNFYHGPRWMGLWNNPNDYGLLMSVGVLLSVGLLADRRWRMEDGKIQNAEGRMKNEEPQSQKAENGNQKFINPHPEPLPSDGRGKSVLCSLRSFAAIYPIVLFIAAGMMAVGLLFSYSRGAWLGTAIGLLYLAKQTKAESEKRKAKIIWYSLPLVAVAAAVVLLFWNTPRTVPWYFQRLDLSRGSVQHRLEAWKAGFEIMRDHPFGVGWNKTVSTYQEHYSPPEGGAPAITTNDYLMLGTQLGIPALVCFVAYVALALKGESRKQKAEILSPLNQIGNRKSEIGNELACRAGALAMLVAFWFDGGLFKLATAAVFWILLELGASKAESRKEKAETVQKSEVRSQKSGASNPTFGLRLLSSGFTLIELLVVIAIIGVLAAMLLPVLNQAKNRGVMVTDINNLQEQTLAMHLYASDHNDCLPWPNWHAHGTTRPGWLYAFDPTATGPARFKVQTGLFWPTLHDPRLYFCPMDNTNSPLSRQRDQQCSSYVMNGAVNGYDRKLFPCVKLGSMAPDAAVFWEADEMYPNYFNDGASFPWEGVSGRHLQGGGDRPV